jgi:hypothetical protein
MAQYRFDLASRAVVTVCFALLASPLGCQLGNDDGAGQDTSPAESDSPSDVSARDDERTPRVAPEAEPTAPRDDSERAAAQSSNPTPPASSPDPETPPPAPAQTFEACTSSETGYGEACESIYVTMKQMSPPRCVQLTIDNCGGYSRQGLSVDAPVSWRLASGSVGSNLNECELGTFYSSSAVALDASGSITWNETTRLPTEVVLDVTLEPSGSAEDTASVDVVTAQPLNPVACDD